MSSIVTGILSSTVGLLWLKARNVTAAKLCGGDVMDAKIRQIIMPDLTDLKMKLDGVLRKDLGSSYQNLKEGVNMLNDAFENSKMKQNIVLNGAREDSKFGYLDLSEELHQAIKKLKSETGENLFEDAKERLKLARIKATDAFTTDGLSIEDKLFAAKVRVASELLEFLERPETAISACRTFLEELHRVPDIVSNFEAYLKGRFRWFKAEQEAIVKSVMLINYVLFRYTFKFSTKHISHVLSWPTIELKDRCIRTCPVLQWLEIAEKMFKSVDLVKPPNGLILDEDIEPPISAINNRGDVVVENRVNSSNMKIISRTGESSLVKLPDLDEDEVVIKDVKAIAVDSNNCLYVVRWLRVLKRDGTNGTILNTYVLNVFDENFNAKHKGKLDFIDADSEHRATAIAINQNKNIILIRYRDSYVYVCYDNGKLKRKFERDFKYWMLTNLNISAAGNEIMVFSGDYKAIKIYTEEGNLRSTLHISAGHEVLGMAFHYVISKILVLTLKKESYFLVLYTEEGAHETTRFVCNRRENEWRPSIVSHPSGPVAIVREKSISYI